MSNPITARQGDVLLIPSTWPARGATVAPPTEDARVVLAYGEVTGHHHSLSSRLAELAEINGRRFVRVAGASDAQHDDAARALNAAIVDAWAPAKVATTPIAALKAQTAAIVRDAEQRGFAALQHLGLDGLQADHLPVILPPGYVGEIKMPREYVRGELPRAVED